LGFTFTDALSGTVDVQLNRLTDRIEIVDAADPTPLREISIDSPQWSTFSRVHIEISGSVLRARLDDGDELRALLPQPPVSLALMTEATGAEFAGLTITRGWEDRFADREYTTLDLGWQGDHSGWSIADNYLQKLNDDTGALFKIAPACYEFVANARIQSGSESEVYGFYPAAGETSNGPLIEITRVNNQWVAVVIASGDRIPQVISELPGFAPAEFEQFRFRVRHGTLSIARGSEVLLEMPREGEATRVGLYARGHIAFDMVRVTELTDEDNR